MKYQTELTTLVADDVRVSEVLTTQTINARQAINAANDNNYWRNAA